MNPDEYRCSLCGGVFKKGWTDEEMAAERDTLFPSYPKSQMVVVCDDCFKVIMSVRHN